MTLLLFAFMLWFKRFTLSAYRTNYIAMAQIPFTLFWGFKNSDPSPSPAKKKTPSIKHTNMNYVKFDVENSL